MSFRLLPHRAVVPCLWRPHSHISVRSAVTPQLDLRTPEIPGSLRAKSDAYGRTKDVWSRKQMLTYAREFTTRAEDGTTNLGDATQTLATVRSRIECVRRYDDKKALCRELSLGSRTLLWLWTHGPSDDEGQLQVTPDFLGPLCWFLVAEGRDEYLRDWVDVMRRKCFEVRSSSQPEQLWEAYHHYTGRIAGNLLRALLYWAPDGNPNNAMKEFFELHTLNESSGIHFKGLNILSSVTAVQQRLRDGDCPPCDVVFFERFLEVGSTVYGDLSESSRAQAMLYHPSTPDAAEFFALVDSEHHYLCEALFDNIRYDAVRSLSVAFLRAAYILKLQGYPDKAAKLEEIVQRKDKHSWDLQGRETQRFKRDARLNKLRAEYSRS